MPRVLMAVMGPYPMALDRGGTTHDRFLEIAQQTARADVTLYVLPDLRTVLGDTQFGDSAWGPKHRTIHSMRCLAAWLAKNGKYDWLFIVENDVDLPVDVLDRLIERDTDLIVPRHEWPMFPLIRPMNYQPVPKAPYPGVTGLHRIQWCGYPATLFNMYSFDHIDPMFIGGGEGRDYEWWHSFGIETWMDLDVEAVNLRLPGPYQVMLTVPGVLTQHMKKNEAGERVACHGGLHEYRERDKNEVETFHLECIECKYRVSFTPPAGFRGEELHQLDILGQFVG